MILTEKIGLDFFFTMCYNITYVYTVNISGKEKPYENYCYRNTYHH